MKQHSEIRSLLLAWVEETLDQSEQRKIEDHLRECSLCREYLEKTSRALLPSSDLPQRSLMPDPYLPTRVRALAERSQFDSHPKSGFVVRWSLRSAAFAVAVVLGILMGERLASPSSTLTDQRIIAEYSESIQTSDIGDRWQSVAQSTEEVSK